MGLNLRAAAGALLAMAASLGSVAGTVAPSAAPASAATRFVDPTFAVDVSSNMAYGRATGFDGVDRDLLLDLYTPRDDTSAARPLFLFVHGGGFSGGSKSSGDAPGWGEFLAARGYVVASIDYRLGTLPVINPVDTAVERQQIDGARADLQTAIRWARAHAAALGIDPLRIAVGGSSAGAITALGAAIHADDPLPGDWSGLSSAVCTAVSVYGANEPSAIGPDDAGAIFFHGTADSIVPIVLAQATADAMNAAGLPTEFHAYPGEQHGLTPAIQDQVKQLTVPWLLAHLVDAPYPCSPAVGTQDGVPSATSTPFTAPAASRGRSAVVSLVAAGTTGPGYVQLLPCGTAPGGWANVNADGSGQIRAGLAVVPVPADGRVCVYDQTRTHLVVDLQGSFAAGALDDVDDVRLLDTRSTARPSARAMVPIHGRPDSTAIVSVDAVDSSAAGFVQVLPCSASPGSTANVTMDGPGQIRAQLALVRFDTTGTACVSPNVPTDLVVDLQAYLAPSAIDDVPDVRLLETRTGALPVSGAQLVVHGRSGSTGVVAITATESTGPGFVEVLPCGSAPGATANVNVDRAGETIGSLAFVHFAGDGTACVFVQRATHVVVDLQAYLAPGAFDDVADVRLLDTRPS